VTRYGQSTGEVQQVGPSLERRGGKYRFVHHLVNNIGASVGVTSGNNAFGGATPTYYAPTNQK
jgi:hypothetical protein